MSGEKRRDLAPASGVPPQAPSPGRKLIAVIGIDGYAQLPALHCAVKDALGVQDLMVQHFGFEAPVPPLLDDAATKPAIESLIEDELRRILQPDDALILFFAGHGTTRVARLDGIAVETGYLAPVDARGPDHFSDLIHMEELLRKIGVLPARHILVVLDACHSGMALGSAVSRYRSVGSYVRSLTRNRSRRVITSAKRDELALDSGPIPGHSLFTGLLIQTLKSGSADTDGNGVVTFSELALRLQQQVSSATASRQTPDYGAFYLDDRGELVIALGDRAVGPPAPAPQTSSTEVAGAASDGRPAPLAQGPPPARAASIFRRSPRPVVGLVAVVALLSAAWVWLRSSGHPAAGGAPSGGCPEGMVMAGGQCTTPGGAPASPCDPHDEKACAAQCDRGHAGSCGALGRLTVRRDAARAAELFKRGCDGGDAASCAALGDMYEAGVDIPKNPILAGAMYTRGCVRADGDACVGQGRIEMTKPNGGDADDARRAFDRGCASRSQLGCAVVSVLYGESRPVVLNTQKQLALRQRCDGGNARDCAEIGVLTVASGNKTGGMLDIQRACEGGDAWACALRKKLE